MNRPTTWLLASSIAASAAIAVGLSSPEKPSTAPRAEPGSATPASPSRAVHYKTVKVGDLDIFYREAGPANAPTILLLHGFPTSSQMFRNLIPALADKYHLVAPDYPGFGHSSMPTHDAFDYTFDNLSKVVEQFTDKVGLTRYAIYVQDYGAPIGYRLAAAHPERISALSASTASRCSQYFSGFPRSITN